MFFSIRICSVSTITYIQFIFLPKNSLPQPCGTKDIVEVQKIMNVKIEVFGRNAVINTDMPEASRPPVVTMLQDSSISLTRMEM